MKKPSLKRKRKSKEPELTEAELRQLLIDAGFVFINNKKAAFGKPEKDLNRETMIFPEGSKRGIPVK